MKLRVAALLIAFYLFLPNYSFAQNVPRDQFQVETTRDKGFNWLWFLSLAVLPLIPLLMRRNNRDKDLPPRSETNTNRNTSQIERESMSAATYSDIQREKNQD